MAALLGMIALAGYQNRDKLIEMYKSATSGADAAADSGKQASSGNSPDTSADGVRELVDAFRESGQGSVIESWVNPGKNQPVRTTQLEQAVGVDTIDKLASETGLNRDEVLRRLTADLPRAVDDLTPAGRL